MSDAFFQSEALTYAVAAIAFLAGAHLLLLIFRRAFRHRLRVPARGRDMQCGTSWHSQVLCARQEAPASLVRRDNVEHLIMIGGPSDLVMNRTLPATSGHDPNAIGESWPGNDAQLRRDLGG